MGQRGTACGRRYFSAKRFPFFIHVMLGKEDESLQNQNFAATGFRDGRRTREFWDGGTGIGHVSI
jgi:hypothetical protein